jgi:AraC-like DNA-binding protein
MDKAAGANGRAAFLSDELPAGLNDQQRFRLWRDLYAARYGDCEMSALPDLPFHASSEMALFGDICVKRFTVTLDRMARTARQVAADGREDVLIGFNRGACFAQGVQRGRDVPLERGQAIVHSNAETGECRYQGVLTLAGLSLPRRQLNDAVGGLEDLFPSRLDTTSLAARHLARYLDFLLGPDVIEDDPAVTSTIAHTLFDLVVLALGSAGEAAELATMRGLRAARAREIVAEIQAGFVDPGFSADEVALKLGLSTRYFQELLQETGATFTERVSELRLQKARAMLADRRCDRLKVTEIAFSSGFNGIAYFNQCFRRRFGVSPTQYRGSRCI